MFRYVMASLALLVLACPVVDAQESGRTLLSAARKRAQDARGKKGPERAEVLEDCVRILEKVPLEFASEGPSVARANLALGRLYRQLGRPEKAEPALLAVLKVEGEERPHCDALLALARLYRKQKKRDAAEKVLTQLIDNYGQQSNPRAKALISRAGLYRDAKDYAKAAESLRLCLKDHAELWRRSVDALDALVALKIREKKLPEARKILKAHEEALRARFGAGKHSESLERALAKMRSRGRLGPDTPPVSGGNTP